MTILAGDTTATIDVAVLDDSIIEPTETVEVTLTAITSGDTDITVGSPDTATVNITDDELNQTVTVTAIDPDATEATDSGEFKIALSNISSTDTVVTFSLGGEAVLGEDYQLLIDGVLVAGNEITIPAGDMMVNIEVRPLNDDIVELNEDVIFTLDSVAGDDDISIDSNSDSATVIINDDGDTAEVTLTPVVTEASEQPVGTGVTNGEFLLQLSNESSTATVVDFSATPDGNQTLGAIREGFETSGLAHLQGDYRILADGVEVTGNTFTIPAGTTEVEITIEVIDDVVVETIENFDLTLTGINSADPQISVGSTVGGNVTITDDDQAEIIVKAIQDASEPGQSADDNGFFQVLLIVPGSVDSANPNGIPAPVSYDIGVTFSVTGTANQIPGDPNNPVDFEELESVLFAPGTTTDVIAVTPEDDLLIEGDESVILTLTPDTVSSDILNNLFGSNVTEVFVTDGDCNDATVIIEDNDMIANISLGNDISVNEGDGTVTITATLDVDVPGGITADVVLTGVTADGMDFTINTTGVVFTGTAGETFSIDIDITDDLVIENAETLTVSLDNVVSSAMVVPGTVDITILDNDGDAAISITDVTVNEGDGTATVVATLDTAVQGGVAADVVLTGVTADGDDFTVNTTGINFTGVAGESVSIVVDITDDNVVENSEDLTVSLSGITSAGTTTAGTGTVTIEDNDGAATITISDITVNETDGTISVTATLDRPVQGGVTADVVLTDIDTDSGDYTANTTSISFAGLVAGETASILIDITDDTDAELPEDLQVSLTNVVPAAGGAVSVVDGIVTINDDDFIPTSVAGRHIFYENSAFDFSMLQQSGVGANVFDDGAIAPDKTALLPGQSASFENYTSYSRGINGIIIDIADLPQIPTLATIGDFFEFRVGNTQDVTSFTSAPAPFEIAVRPGDGDNGSDRITIVWADNVIENEWLQVTVKAGLSTGLAFDDVHYWGNAIGETGDADGVNTFVNATDQANTRDNFTTIFESADVENVYDFNRDTLVNATDQAIARDNFTTIFDFLVLLDAPSNFTGGGGSEGGGGRGNGGGGGDRSGGNNLIGGQGGSIDGNGLGDQLGRGNRMDAAAGLDNGLDQNDRSGLALQLNSAASLQDVVQPTVVDSTKSVESVSVEEVAQLGNVDSVEAVSESTNEVESQEDDSTASQQTREATKKAEGTNVLDQAFLELHETPWDLF